MAQKVTPRRNGSSNARVTLEGAAMASSHARLTPMQVLGPTRMVSRSMLVARASIPARLMSVTYDRPVIICLNDAKTHPIARCGWIHSGFVVTAFRVYTFGRSVHIHGHALHDYHARR